VFSDEQQSSSIESVEEEIDLILLSNLLNKLKVMLLECDSETVNKADELKKTKDL